MDSKVFIEGHRVEDCGHCKRIADARAGRLGSLLGEREHSIVVAGDHQFFPGYVMIISKHHVREMHEMPAEVSARLFQDVLDAGRAIDKSFNPWKLNYASLGNVDEHLHWHVMPRYEDDVDKKDHPWKNSAKFANAKTTTEDIIRLKRAFSCFSK